MTAIDTKCGCTLHTYAIKQPAQHGETWFLDAEVKREETFSYASTLRAIGAASPRVLWNILPVCRNLLSLVNPSVLMCDKAGDTANGSALDSGILKRSRYADPLAIAEQAAFNS